SFPSFPNSCLGTPSPKLRFGAGAKQSFAKCGSQTGVWEPEGALLSWASSSLSDTIRLYTRRREEQAPMFDTIFGVDFSGAKLAGPNPWVAHLDPLRRNSRRYRLAALANLEKLSGTAERSAALAWLVQHIAESQHALWALDFPFGLPVEV